jgi:hypothetical protein
MWNGSVVSKHELLLPFPKAQNTELYLVPFDNMFSHLGMPAAYSMQNVFLVTLKCLAAP